ncbi:MAG TPA: hypothetical protein VF661_04650, partial [Actinomycetales bacterium]
MFEDGGSASTQVLRSWLSCLAEPLDAGVPSRGLIEQIAVLEQLKGALAARQARVAVAFDRAQREEQAAAGVPARKVGRGVAEQIALARRESPSRGSRHLGVAKALVSEMPNTLAALASGDIGEWTATLVVKETACLAADDRRTVDDELRGVHAAAAVGGADRHRQARAGVRRRQRRLRAERR